MRLEQWADGVMEQLIRRLRRTSPEIGAEFPHVCREKSYDRTPPRWWTSGFWPGILWLGYIRTGEEGFRKTAEECEKKLDEVLCGHTDIDHDAGFIWTLSAVADYKITGSAGSRRRALMAADLLAGRFNLRGGFLRAWNGEGKEGWSIVDSAMNLALLYWASETSGDPRFRHIAQAHADTVVKHFIREDGSVNHILSFDPWSGELIESIAGQGASPTSSWSRGTAWAIYGMALSFRHTREEKYLDAAKKAAHYFVAGLPEDGVCYWDFRTQVTESTPRDTSAASIAACGLLEIAAQTPPEESTLYHAAAVRILRSLYERYSDLTDDTAQAFLREGTGHMPEGLNVGVGLIYGDYFFLEGIGRLCGETMLFW